MSVRSPEAPLPLPASLLVTPAEVRALRGLLAKARLAAPPPPRSSPVTPGTSTPGTPVAAARTEFMKPDAAWLDDARLPLTSRTATRAFVLGYLLNAAFDAVLPGVLRKISPRDALRRLFSSASSLRAGSALFLYAALYRTILQLLAQLRLGRSAPRTSDAPAQTHRARLQARLHRFLRSPMLGPFVAASLSTPALLLLPASPFPRQMLAIDFASKAAAAAYHESRRSGSRITSWVPAWCDSALLYCVSNAQLLYAYLLYPEAFPAGYGKIIESRSSAYLPPRPHDLPASIEWPTGRQILDGVGELTIARPTAAPYPSFVSPVLSSLQSKPPPASPYASLNTVLDYAPAHPAHSRLLCAVLHPREPSCTRNFLGFFKKEWLTSAKFVAAWMGALQLLSWRKVVKDPETALFKFGMAVVQGATVISGGIGTAWALICVFQHWLPRTLLPRGRFFLNGFIAGLTIYLVPAARRHQLGMYVGRMSAKSTWQILEKEKRVRPVPHGEALLLAGALATMAAMYEARPEALTGYLRAVTSKLVGPRQGAPTVAAAVVAAEKEKEKAA